MPDRLCIECFNELDDEVEHGERCLACEEGQPESWPWEMWAEYVAFGDEDLDEDSEDREEEDDVWQSDLGRCDMQQA